MPISDDLHPRSFVTKITEYDRVVNIPNSNSILHDLLPLAVAMAEHRETGVYNFTNPGAIGHNEVLSLYKQIVDPQFEWSNFTLEEQAEVIKAERSNCELDATKLMQVVERYQCGRRIGDVLRGWLRICRWKVVRRSRHSWWSSGCQSLNMM